MKSTSGKENSSHFLFNPNLPFSAFSLFNSPSHPPIIRPERYETARDSDKARLELDDEILDFFRLSFLLNFRCDFSPQRFGFDLLGNLCVHG